VQILDVGLFVPGGTKSPLEELRQLANICKISVKLIFLAYYKTDNYDK